MLYPANETEEAVEAVLRTIRESCRGILEELDSVPPDQERLVDFAGDLVRAARSLPARWRRLDLDSPYRAGVIGPALDLLGEVANRASSVGGKAEEAVAIEEELADLVMISGQLAVANELTQRLRTEGLSLRGLAKSLSLSPGHLSDLQKGHNGLPSPELCRKLDALLKTRLESSTRETRGHVEGLREKARTRKKERTRSTRRASVLGLTESARIQAVTISLAGDEQLLALVETLIDLPKPAQRGIRKAVKDLADAYAAFAQR